VPPEEPHATPSTPTPSVDPNAAPASIPHPPVELPASAAPPPPQWSTPPNRPPPPEVAQLSPTQLAIVVAAAITLCVYFAGCLLLRG
jgi:hypothetical protein